MDLYVNTNGHLHDVNLPIWETIDDCPTIYIATDDLRQYLGVDYRISQRSEWFALDSIPNNTITFI